MTWSPHIWSNNQLISPGVNMIAFMAWCVLKYCSKCVYSKMDAPFVNELKKDSNLLSCLKKKGKKRRRKKYFVVNKLKMMIKNWICLLLNSLLCNIICMTYFEAISCLKASCNFVITNLKLAGDKLKKDKNSSHSNAPLPSWSIVSKISSMSWSEMSLSFNICCTRVRRSSSFKPDSVILFVFFIVSEKDNQNEDKEWISMDGWMGWYIIIGV